MTGPGFCVPREIKYKCTDIKTIWGVSGKRAGVWGQERQLLSIKEIGRGKVLKPGKVRRDLLHHWALGSQDLCFCQSVEYLLWREPNRSSGSALHDLEKEKRASCPKLHSHLVARHWRTLYAGSVVCSSSCWWWRAMKIFKQRYFRTVLWWRLRGPRGIRNSGDYLEAFVLGQARDDQGLSCSHIHREGQKYLRDT